MATIAVFGVLGGGAYAVSNKAPKDSVNSKAIVDGSVKGKDVKDNSLTGNDIDQVDPLRRRGRSPERSGGRRPSRQLPQAADRGGCRRHERSGWVRR